MTRVPIASAVSVSVRGVVQGVGFRPFIYQLATRHNLRGWVCNTSEDVRIEVEGEGTAIERFLQDLPEKAPPRARIENITVGHQSPSHYEKFEIRHSRAEDGKYQLVSPDIATCPDCLREILDPQDQRYRYPFTNCTNCGPRFTIIEDIPYDRPKTTMRHFRMCPLCRDEYNDPINRRFHTQPNACPVCGPHLELVDAGGGAVTGTDAITATSQLLNQGKIVAVKGLGGFLLACDATNKAAVKLLRDRKQRPSKPLAVMLASLSEIKEHCQVNKSEENLLTSPASPIVLMKWKARSTIVPAVAPGLRYLGVMLPYTPLHHLLLQESGLSLVMTSGNLSEEPIARDNDEALRRLGGIADYFLLHNRDIYSRYDDSVAMVTGKGAQIIRRARGYAPYPIPLKFTCRQILGCGSEEKNTFSLTRDNYAFVSQHIGDMENLETLEHFDTTVELYKRLFRIDPELIAYDMHPQYLATKYAKSHISDLQSSVAVQHHHAHIASCLADNGWSPDDGPVIGVAWDGTGYGIDRRIWGGEFLVADYHGFRRLAHLEYLPMPGGEAAIRNPYRLAIGYLYALTGHLPLDVCSPPFSFETSEEELRIIQRQIDRGVNCPQTSAGGRLFDAVSALLGIRERVSYEAQAAIELEMAAQIANPKSQTPNPKSPISNLRSPMSDLAYPFDIEEGGDGGKRVAVIRLRALFEALIADRRDGVAAREMAYRFHVTVAEMMRAMCKQIAQETGLRTVALSGGCFQNRLLLALVVPRLHDLGLRVLVHRHVPCNDGGISLGQAVIAHFAVEHGLSEGI